MKNIWLVTTLIMLIYIGPSIAQNVPVPFPKPEHEGLNVKKLASIDLGKNKTLDFDAWVQYRVLFNYSNIPGPGGSTFDSTRYYQFFRQRFRLATDIRFTDADKGIKTGGYMQLEYQGGWGGSAPAYGDPRASVPVMNPFNRLQPRGLRYGFVYFDNEKLNLQVGILPITDQVGRVLFDADWDFNAGGITIGGNTTKTSYRLGYVRLIEAVGAKGIDSISANGNMYIADFDYTIKNKFVPGIHFYGFTAPGKLGLELPTYELWPGLTFDANLENAKFKFLFLLNSGKIKSATHTGIATKGEANIKLGKNYLSLLALYATGDEAGLIKNRFVSLHELTGTAGYWAYLHIFTPAGPSDVNDLGLNPGNGGAGVITFQGKYDFKIKKDKLSGQLFAGYVGSAKKRNNTTFMGVEFGGMSTYSFGRFLNLDLGISYAALGDFYMIDADALIEIFSRIQFTW